MHPFNHRSVLSGHQTRGLCASNTYSVDGLLLPQPKGSCGSRRCREYSYCCSLMPALPYVFLSHTNSHSGPNFVSSDCRGEKVSAAESWPNLCNGEERWQGNGSYVHYPHAMYIVEFESMDECPVNQGCVGGGETDRGTQHNTTI